MKDEKEGGAPVERIELRPAVKWFAEQMELRLRRNDHKGGWSNCTHSYLKRRLRNEVSELEHELTLVENNEMVIHEAADVANFAMMIADIAGPLIGDSQPH